LFSVLEHCFVPGCLGKSNAKGVLRLNPMAYG